MLQPKRRRTTYACDFCHRRGLKCKSELSDQDASSQGDITPSSAPCLTCVEYGQQCTRSRRPKKRGTKPRDSSHQGFSKLKGNIEGYGALSSPLVNRRTVTALLDVYIDSIHPIFPLFCERELWVGWRDGSFPKDDSEYMSLICMCALSAQHVQKRALFTDETDTPVNEQVQKDYLDEAIRLVPYDLRNIDLNLIRSYGLLALLGSQTGNNTLLHKYLGLYHGLSAQISFQDEARWPSGLSECEREVRRRLWWAMYRLEVHTACVLGTLVRAPEEQAFVGYPKGTHHPPFIPGRDGDFEDWFAGWNTTTDLYRVLEHVLVDFRRAHRRSESILGRQSGSQSEIILQRLARLQADLLPQFTAVASKSGDSGRNRCGFQASNILCTIYLARLLSCISSGIGIQVACYNAHEMVDTMRKIPIDYVRAIGSPLVQQLAGVGHILMTAMSRQPQTQADRQATKDAVLAILALLDVFKQQNVIASPNQHRLAARLAEMEPSTETVELNEEGNTDSFNEALNLISQDHGQEDWSTAFPTELLMDVAWPFPEPH